MLIKIYRLLLNKKKICNKINIFKTICKCVWLDKKRAIAKDCCGFLNALEEPAVVIVKIIYELVIRKGTSGESTGTVLQSCHLMSLISSMKVRVKRPVFQLHQLEKSKNIPNDYPIKLYGRDNA